MGHELTAPADISEALQKHSSHSSMRTFLGTPTPPKIAFFMPFIPMRPSVMKMQAVHKAGVVAFGTYNLLRFTMRARFQYFQPYSGDGSVESSVAE